MLSDKVENPQLMMHPGFAGLCKLNFSHNAMGHKGLRALCENLSAATPITSLSLAGNRLSDQAAMPLAGLLLPCSTCQLSFLDLSQAASMGTTAAIKLLQALEYNTTLNELSLANSQLGMILLTPPKTVPDSENS